MMYLLIVVGIGQLLLFAFCYKMLSLVKRRYKILDARIANLGQWVITSTETMAKRIEQMSNEQPDKTEQPAETVLRPVVNNYVG